MTLNFLLRTRKSCEWNSHTTDIHFCKIIIVILNPTHAHSVERARNVVASYYAEIPNEKK